ncbi:hypothetical protein Drose_06110 [Dactylosporangium roseum]|uniref:Uncharacterized protein n=1 Tax=Dactylosporangium roseum TaxID=47989 RepID=A0ABY5Z8F7_9ACTN|nr:hypothetical protein [Dactylosporangium roseum]UWZ37846.1 hypothetical protein Drose_06110 [Dactylosporangium roseum]
MAIRADQAQTDPVAALLKRVDRLEAQLRELRAARRLESASVGAGGVITVRDGGSIRLLDQSGGTVGLLGDLSPYGPGLKGVLLYRPGSGAPAIAVHGTGESGDLGFVGVYDRAGNLLLSDNTSGPGLATPWIPLQGVPTTWHASPQQSTTSPTFVALWTVTGIRQHPNVQAHLLVSSDVGVTGEIQVRDPVSDTVIAGPLAIADGATTHVTLTGPLPGGVAHMAQFRADVEMRVASGAGSVGSSLIYAVGVQSP